MTPRAPLRPAGVGLALAALVLLPAGRRAEVAPIRPPAALMDEIRKMSEIDAGSRGDTAGEQPCSSHPEAEWPLDWSHQLLLKDGRLLLLLQVPECNSRSTRILPVTVDRRGKWRWGEPLQGTLKQFGTARDGSIWVASQWEIEYGAASVNRSSDGVTWKEMELPAGRATFQTHAEMLSTFCLLGERVEVQVEGQDEKGSDVEQTWSHGLAPASGWKREPRLSTRCAEPRPPASACHLDPSSGPEVILRCGGRSVALPKGLAAKPAR